MNRQALEKLKRCDLQRLCRDYGIKANMKTETLIDLLEKCTDPENPSPRKRVVTRAGSRSLDRTNSTDSFENESAVAQSESGEAIVGTAGSNTASDPELAESCESVTQTRFRKAKEQTRLGFGRPALPPATRTIPRPPGSSRRATRASRSSRHADLPSIADNTIQEEGPSTVEPHVDPIEQAVTPLMHRIKALEAERSTLSGIQAELQQMKSQQSMWEMRFSTLHTTIGHLTAELETLKQSQDKGKAPLYPSTIGQFIKAGNAISPPINTTPLPRPSIPPAVIGKRGRDSISSTLSGSDLGKDEEPPIDLRPAKKRPRIGSSLVQDPAPSGAAPALLPAPTLNTDGPRAEESPLDEDAPPRTPLPTYFGPSTPPPRAAATNPAAPALLATPTSSFPASFPVFPLEEPASPSPQSNRTLPEINARSLSRTDSPSKPSASTTATSTSGFTFGSLMLSNPDAGLNSFMPSLRMSSESNPFNFGGGSQAPSRPPAATRTMYGTEVDKFSDFNLDTYSSGPFWG